MKGLVILILKIVVSIAGYLRLSHHRNLSEEATDFKMKKAQLLEMDAKSKAARDAASTGTIPEPNPGKSPFR
jgi:hypothetical protein